MRRDGVIIRLRSVMARRDCTIIRFGLDSYHDNDCNIGQVARNVVLEPKLLPGGGAVEMSVAAHLRREALAVQACARNI